MDDRGRREGAHRPGVQHLLLGEPKHGLSALLRMEEVGTVSEGQGLNQGSKGRDGRVAEAGGGVGAPEEAMWRVHCWLHVCVLECVCVCVCVVTMLNTSIIALL